MSALPINTSRCTDVETWDEAHFLARLDFELVRGSEITLDCYYVLEDDVIEDVFDSEARFTVTTAKGWEDEIARESIEYLNPAWDLKTVNPTVWQNSDSTWAEAPSYRVLEAVPPASRIG